MGFAETALKRANDSYLDFISCRAVTTKDGCSCKGSWRSVTERKETQSRPVQSTDALILVKINEVSRRFGLVSLNRQISACETLFGHDQIIDVAILGQLKAGKSSLKRIFLASLINGR